MLVRERRRTFVGLDVLALRGQHAARRPEMVIAVKLPSGAARVASGAVRALDALHPGRHDRRVRFRELFETKRDLPGLRGLHAEALHELVDHPPRPSIPSLRAERIERRALHLARDVGDLDQLSVLLFNLGALGGLREHVPAVLARADSRTHDREALRARLDRDRRRALPALLDRRDRIVLLGKRAVVLHEQARVIQEDDVRLAGIWPEAPARHLLCKPSRARHPSEHERRDARLVPSLGEDVAATQDGGLARIQAREHLRAELAIGRAVHVLGANPRRAEGRGDVLRMLHAGREHDCSKAERSALPVIDDIPNELIGVRDALEVLLIPVLAGHAHVGEIGECRNRHSEHPRDDEITHFGELARRLARRDDRLEQRATVDHIAERLARGRPGRRRQSDHRRVIPLRLN